GSNYCEGRARGVGQINPSLGATATGYNRTMAKLHPLVLTVTKCPNGMTITARVALTRRGRRISSSNSFAVCFCASLVQEMVERFPVLFPACITPPDRLLCGAK